MHYKSAPLTIDKSTANKKELFFALIETATEMPLNYSRETMQHSDLRRKVTRSPTLIIQITVFVNADQSHAAGIQVSTTRSVTCDSRRVPSNTFITILMENW